MSAKVLDKPEFSQSPDRLTTTQQKFPSGLKTPGLANLG